MLTWVQVHLKKKSKLNRVLNILFPFAKEFEVILKYVEGCLVTTVSWLSERSFVFSFAAEGESGKSIGDKVPEEMKEQSNVIMGLEVT